jgi:hypothetical protein
LDVPPEFILAGFALVCSVPVLITAMVLVSRHVALRRQSQKAVQSDEIARRLERIDQAVDAIAIEVERLSESNRFVAKLLAERSEVSR